MEGKVILAGDVGATKILLEAGDLRSGRWRPAIARRYLIADFENFSQVLAAFLAEFDEVKGRSRIGSAALGVAGPVQGNKVKMTHRAWTLDGDALSKRFHLPRVRILNDLAAAAHGLGSLAKSDFTTLQPGKAVSGEPRVVLGVGTGLGVAYLQRVGGRDEVVPGEGGHIGFSPSSAEQAELWRAMFATRGRVGAEEVCSGMGISNIYEFMRDRNGLAGVPQRADPAWISQMAGQGDAACVNTLDLFAECLGNVAGDQALTVMARGGVYLAGGVMAKSALSFNAERFRAAFCAKGSLSSLLMRVPVKLVTNERVALIGAASVSRSRAPDPRRGYTST